MKMDMIGALRFHSFGQRPVSDGLENTIDHNWRLLFKPVENQQYWRYRAPKIA